MIRTCWLQQFEPCTEVPDHTNFGRIPERQVPHVYSEPEIVDLLAAARRLGPALTLRGVLFQTLCGLIDSCGLRIGDALALRNEDVDPRREMVTIRKAKFGNSRQAPIHPSTIEALRLCHWTRDLADGRCQASCRMGREGQAAF